MFNKRQFGQPQQKEKKDIKSCKRIIKRDEQGRIVREEFVGSCSKEQMESFRERKDEDR